MPIKQDPTVHNLVICANIFVRKNEKYLLIKRSPNKRFAAGFVHPFGGKIESDENPFSGAQRELLEETGIKVINMRLEAVFLELHSDRKEFKNWLIYHFSADYRSGKMKKTEEGELVMLNSRELLNQNLYPSVRKTIKTILDPKISTVFATFTYDNDRVITKSVINHCVK